MMKNMFSMFDPSSSYLSFSWTILFLPIILMSIFLFKQSLNIKKSLSYMLKLIEKQMNQIMIMNKHFSSMMMTNLFMMVMVVNLMALLPFNFTPTAHISISFSISLILWLSIMLWGWLKSFKKMMIHLTPMGTPNQLMNFMVIIEMISNMIRPITLSVRLSANLVAGHLLMSLLSSFSLLSNNNSFISMMFITLLMSLEVMVAMVQAYVMSTLLTLYHNESM